MLIKIKYSFIVFIFYDYIIENKNICIYLYENDNMDSTDWFEEKLQTTQCFYP